MGELLKMFGLANRKKQIQVLLVAIIFTLNIICGKSEWVNHGGGILNHRSAVGPGEKITASSVSRLAVKWKFLTGFDVSATPSISDKAIYFPGWDGNLYALCAETGKLIWNSSLTELTGVATVSRATPVIAGNVLLVGLSGPAVVIAVDRGSGKLIWKTKSLDEEPNTVITMSGTVYEGFYFVGVSSLQETGHCCSFQGSFQKIDLKKKGTVVWRTSVLPPSSGYFGAALWGSSPSIDETRRLVYIATGNNYQVPDSVEQCELNQANKTQRDFPDPCVVPENRQDSMLALDIDNGRIVWSRQLQGYDAFTVTCLMAPNNPNCPKILGPDYDFGEAPMLLYLKDRKGGREKHSKCVVVAGQKSGVVWALDCDDGGIVWTTVAGPGGPLGGATWGSCTDGERVYTNIANSLNHNFTLAPSSSVTKGGGWVALEASTGKVVWSTANPSGAPAFGPLSVANGVVFAGSFAPSGEVYALDASTGRILWEYSTGAQVYGGFSIAHGCVYGGHGYSHFSFGSNIARGIAVFAFCV